MDTEYSSKIRTGRFGEDGQSTIFNRLLEAETDYSVKVRAFTQSGFMDTECFSKIRTGRFGKEGPSQSCD